MISNDLKKLYQRANGGVLTRPDKLLAKGDANYLGRRTGNMIDGINTQSLEDEQYEDYLKKLNPETNPFVSSIPQKEIFRLNQQSRDAYIRDRERDRQIREYSRELGEDEDDYELPFNNTNKQADDIVTAIEQYWMPKDTYKYSKGKNTSYSRSLSQAGLYDAWKEKEKEYDQYMGAKHNKNYAGLPKEEEQAISKKYEGKTKDYASLSKRWMHAGGSVKYDRYGNPYLDWEKTAKNAEEGKSPNPYEILTSILPEGNLNEEHANKAYNKAAELAETNHNYSNKEDIRVIDTSKLTDEEYKQLAPHVIDLYEHKILGQDKAELRKQDPDAISSPTFSLASSIGGVARGVVKSVDDVLSLANTLAKLAHGGLGKETLADKFIKRSALRNQEEMDKYFGDGTYAQVQDTAEKQNNQRFSEAKGSQDKMLDALRATVGAEEAEDYVKSYSDTYSLTDVFDKWSRKLLGRDYAPKEGDVIAEKAQQLGEIATLFVPGSGIAKASSKGTVVKNVLKKALGFQAGSDLAEKTLEKATLSSEEEKEGLKREANYVDLIVSLASGEIGSRAVPKMLDKLASGANSYSKKIAEKLKSIREKNPQELEDFIKGKNFTEQEADVLRMVMGKDTVSPDRELFVESLAKNKDVTEGLVKNLADLKGKIDQNKIDIFDPALNTYQYSAQELNEKALNDLIQKHALPGKLIQRPQLPVNYRPHENLASEFKNIVRSRINVSPDNYAELLDKNMFTVPISNIKELRASRNTAWEEAKKALGDETFAFSTPFETAKNYASKIEEEPENIRGIIKEFAEATDRDISYAEALELRRNLKRRARQLKAGANPDNRAAYILEDIAHGFDKDLAEAASTNEYANKALQANKEYAQSSESIEKKKNLLKEIVGDNYLEQSLRSSTPIIPDVPEDIASGLNKLELSERSKLLEEFGGDLSNANKARQVWLNDLEKALDTETGMRLLSDYSMQDIQNLFGGEENSQLYSLLNKVKEIYNPAKKDWTPQQAISAVNTAFSEGWETSQINKLKDSISEVLDNTGKEQLDKFFKFNELEKDVLQKNAIYKSIVSEDATGLAKKIQNSNDVNTLNEITKQLEKVYGSENSTVVTIKKQIEDAKDAKIVEMFSNAKWKLESLSDTSTEQEYLEALKNIVLNLEPKQELINKLFSDSNLARNFKEFYEGGKQLISLQEEIQKKQQLYKDLLQKKYAEPLQKLENQKGKAEKILNNIERRENLHLGFLGFSILDHGLSTRSIVLATALKILQGFAKKRAQIKLTKLGNDPNYISNILKINIKQQKKMSKSLDGLYKVLDDLYAGIDYTTMIKQLSYIDNKK